MDKEEKIARKGQLMFGYVDWDTELEHTKERWRELARYAERIFGYRKPKEKPPFSVGFVDE